MASARLKTHNVRLSLTVVFNENFRNKNCLIGREIQRPFTPLFFFPGNCLIFISPATLFTRYIYLLLIRTLYVV